MSIFDRLLSILVKVYINDVNKCDASFHMMYSVLHVHMKFCVATAINRHMFTEYVVKKVLQEVLSAVYIM